MKKIITLIIFTSFIYHYTCAQCITKVGTGQQHTLHYIFSLYANAAIPGIAGFGLFALLFVVGRRNRRFFAVAACMCAALFISCNKVGYEPDLNTRNDIYIRIAQVDRDSTKAYSRIVKVIQE